MKKISLLTLLGVLFSLSAFSQQAANLKSNYFEIRKYYANPGKLPDLIKRFQDHTVALFEKSGMENVAYFVPVENNDNSLTYILGYPDEEARDRMWNQFLNDPEWKKAYQESIVDGALVSKIDQTFMTLAPGLNEMPMPSKSGVFQLRVYTCLDGKIDNLIARFKDHTQDLFARQGLKNYPYWITSEKEGGQPKLVYLLGHEDKAKFEAAFQNFLKDPDWVAARDASEANGKIVEKVDATFFTTLPFSPMK
ncbi:NIPSNAP family protein [Algoriphagus halophilus]|uniref:NIPSNAP protein n=1 Tax=Algoriphagus halophilus TaxID=226505 RepID=A0A1N6H5Z1_9BACT|nr:NIPSNAP family protein [Algoriphagus halophilus]SIO15087.1 NIPSNAP protein [Algoriphagus halophilus]